MAGGTLNAIIKVPLLVALFCALLPSGEAFAHPLSQGTLNITVRPDRVSVRARVTIEEVLVTSMVMSTANLPTTPQRSIDETYAQHARYLTEHIQVIADGLPLQGRVVRVIPPSTQPAEASLGPDKTHLEYEFNYGRADMSARPKKLELRQDVLVNEEFAPGVKWEASYAIRIGVEGGPVSEGLLLTSSQPMEYACDWTVSSTGGATEVQVHRGQLFRDYFTHGIHHILTGYDHLLFISALVLAATGVWDLVKVVSAFTLAHTITLTLAALRLVYLPEGVVEPMIAASIVVVALQNVFWPKHARGWGRLAIAFGFGLFHGLGFAGGLLDAMHEMTGLTIALAIVAFSLGVEIGHQMIVLPLFVLLKLARHTTRETERRDRISLHTMRYGSAAICAAGVYYLVAATIAAMSVRGTS